VYSVHDSSPRKIVVSDARYLSVAAGTKDFFAVVHHWDGKRLELTAHPHADPQQVISRISLPPVNSLFPSRLELLREGEMRVWDRLPGAFTGYAFEDYRLILTRHIAEDDVQTLSWFDDSYDRGYQGIVGATEVPDTSFFIISVQRDSHPVLYDPETRTALRKLTLADRGGNPAFQLRAAAHEFWAIDYDAIVKLDVKTLELISMKVVQDVDRGSRQFVGGFCFNSEQDLCLIARPFSGDAVALDAISMAEISRIPFGRTATRYSLAGQWENRRARLENR
jgi:hypothetical protein